MRLWPTILGLGLASAAATYLAAWSVRRWFRLKPGSSGAVGWALWVLGSTGVIWLAYLRVEAEAAASHQANVGIPMLFLGLWMLCSIVSPAIGLAAFLLKGNLEPD